METFNRRFILLAIWVICDTAAASHHKSVKDNSTRITCSSFAKKHVYTHLDTLLANEDNFMSKELPPFLVSRPPDSNGISEVRKHIKSTLKSLNWAVERDISKQLTVLGFKRFVNIIATHNYFAPKRIVLACHYDSKLLPLGFVGAMDSAVPCAILLQFVKTFNTILDQMRSVSHNEKP
ncbi:glutaminyl-peptide cyclotransferase-like protein [Plakobranchus ocellatus]|uniref:glutaminyl-peptide cyclotransferase n=1 Tax=Plakobranchus ocellatus TaxID=259542 RepID=A0AAV4DX82_9GAST|nr:glutaminyl-peptide cyclotransferase-like protein [Plakobranchus ocellatus]